jgi:hypothetical protein
MNPFFQTWNSGGTVFGCRTLPRSRLHPRFCCRHEKQNRPTENVLRLRSELGAGTSGDKAWKDELCWRSMLRLREERLHLFETQRCRRQDHFPWLCLCLLPAQMRVC